MRPHLCFGLIISLFVLRPAMATAATGYALVIASGEFMPGSPYTRSSLTGPHSDVRLMTSLLIWRFGFVPRNIKLVGVAQSEAAQIAIGLRSIDDHATFAAIRQGFDWLARVATAPNDPVVVYYAGHGKRVNNPDRLAHDVNSEALVTYDADAVDANLVRDVQIKAWLNRIGSQRKTVIIDCCFSGDMIRDVSDGEGLPGGRTVRGIGSDRDSVPPLRREFEMPRTLSGAEGDSTGRVFDDLPAGTVLLAACGKKGHAYEKRLLPADGRPATAVGEFTWALYRVLCHDQWPLSYQALCARVAERFHERGLTQTPALLGRNTGLNVIGPSPWTDRSLHLPFQSSSEQEPLLGVGWFSGLRSNRDLLPADTGLPIRILNLGWFDARLAGARPSGDGYLTVQQFP